MKSQLDERAAAEASDGAASVGMASRRREQVALGVLSLALAAVLAAAGLFVNAETSIATDRTLPLGARVSAADRMMRLRPFSTSTEVRYAILRGRQLFVAGQWAQAQTLLYETYLRNIGNQPLRRELSTVNLAIQARDAGKAHRQHGHEGPGGTLQPGDIER